MLFRKPWLIPLLPFQFIKLNLDFIRRNKTSTGKAFNSYERDEKTLMLYVASEGGKAACDRAMDVTKNWLAKSRRHHIVIVSSNTGMVAFDEPNMSLYMLPDPKSTRVVSKKGWNLSCENVLYRAIHSHAPSRFIFDGPYPYRGILNAIGSVREMDTVWIVLNVQRKIYCVSVHKTSIIRFSVITPMTHIFQEILELEITHL